MTKQGASQACSENAGEWEAGAATTRESWVPVKIMFEARTKSNSDIERRGVSFVRRAYPW